MVKGYLKIMVLDELRRNKHTGYELMNLIHEKTGKKPSAGSMYPLLNELLSKGFIKSHEQGRKKIYSITPKGKKRIEVLFHNKKEMLNKSLEAYKGIAEITGSNEKSPLIDFALLIKKQKKILFNNISLWSELHLIIVKLGNLKDYSKIQAQFKSALKNFIKELKTKELLRIFG